MLLPQRNHDDCYWLQERETVLFWISVFSFCFIIAVLFKILEKTIFFKDCPLVVNVVIEFTTGFYEQYL